MAKQPWNAWHDVVKLRDDLRSGKLPMHMFAADLYEVMMQNGKRPIYEKTAYHGHFGRTDVSWEETSRVDALKEAVASVGAAAQ